MWLYPVFVSIWEPHAPVRAENSILPRAPSLPLSLRKGHLPESPAAPLHLATLLRLLALANVKMVTWSQEQCPCPPTTKRKTPHCSHGVTLWK